MQNWLFGAAPRGLGVRNFLSFFLFCEIKISAIFSVHFEGREIFGYSIGKHGHRVGNRAKNVLPGYFCLSLHVSLPEASSNFKVTVAVQRCCNYDDFKQGQSTRTSLDFKRFFPKCNNPKKSLHVKITQRCYLLVFKKRVIYFNDITKPKLRSSSD